MARVPDYPLPEPRRRRRETTSVIKPEGKFIRPHKIRITTDRSPESVTSINPDDMKPILPEMPYIPPA
ncbi:MAG TPA: hypothetical protein VGK48_06745 [Terriglobia bacterium]|jgi:hypothetical protein